MLSRLFVSVLASATFLSAQSAIDTLRREFEHPPEDSRILMRWWWFGPSVTKPELEREMRLMEEGGIGGFEVQPVYPLALDDPAHGFHNLPYLSDEYIDMLRFASQKAHELGLRMDITLGSGWPFGGPHTPITEAAGKLRCDRIPVPANARSIAMPDITAGEKFIAAFLARGDGSRFAPQGIQQLSDIRDGRLRLPTGLDGSHVVLFFVSSRTGQQVKRAAIGAEGFVLDHYDRTAIEHHLQSVGERLMQAFGPNPPNSVFSDSLEVYGSDWTADLLAEFQKRRGYDLTPYLPALVGDIGPKTADIRHDWGLTLTELCEERYLTPINEWAHRHGTKFRSQTYGIPPATLSSNALVDLPEGEGVQWRAFSTTRWASSANHLYNRPITSSETWTWLHSPVFRATPLDMKAEADIHFLEGVNQLIGHGWPYSPEMAGEPGWRFYAAAVFNQHNPWWLAMPDITLYLQRVSYLLRQGEPANDVALYLPVNDAYARFTAGHVSIDESMNSLLGNEVIPQILNAGYNFDFIDDAAIAKVGVGHPVLIMPKVARMPTETVRKLDEYKSNGGIMAQGASDIAKLFPPDFAAGVPAVGFIHRKLRDGDIYFIANTGNIPVQTIAHVRAKGTLAEWWDPQRGGMTPARIDSGSVALALEPYESRVLVIFNGRPASANAPAPAATAARRRLDLGSDWNVSFPALNRTVAMSRLRSWTEDEDTLYYSGQAIYEKTVTVPAAFLENSSRAFLNFGGGTPVTTAESHMGYRALLESPVREAAVVSIDGKRVGSVWSPPYELDVTAWLHAGDNRFSIAVGNLGINTLAGQSLPTYRLLNLRYTERFTPQDMDNLKPLPSGLLGPLTLISR